MRSYYPRMIRLSKLTDYASVVLTELARTPEALRSAGAVAESTGVPRPTVTKVLKLLTQAELTRSIQGPKGGYQLARSARQIDLADIIAAIEGPSGVTECATNHDDCELTAHCHVMDHWQRVSVQINQLLRSVTLAELATPKLQRIPTLQVQD